MDPSRDEASCTGAPTGASFAIGPVSASPAEEGEGESANAGRVRARDLGIAPGTFPTGERNAINDVEGVLVGHVTLVEGDNVRTGVTAVRPHPGNVFQEKVAGAVHIGNASGKLAGSTQVAELGTIETPIILTNTLAVGRAVDAVVGWTLEQPGNETVGSVNALVGETNDGILNDIRGRNVTAHDVVRAIETASDGLVEEGAVGAGTGTVCFGWKGGIGTSSRRLPSGFTIGVLVQTNYGGSLTIDGMPLAVEFWSKPTAAGNAGAGVDSPSCAEGSCMVVVATDAPLSQRSLERLGARAIFALARTGAAYSNGSGDYAVAFSTSSDVRVPHESSVVRTHRLLPNDGMSPLFQATLEATEEAVYNSLFMATTTTGNGRTIEALPLKDVRRLLRTYDRHGDGQA
jgi:D-aminopeptidase